MTHDDTNDFCGYRQFRCLELPALEAPIAEMLTSGGEAEAC